MTQSAQNVLPHQTDGKFLSDAGFETSMLFHKGFDLPLFAYFPMLETPEGRLAMKEYYAEFIETARLNDAGFILDTNTWRANFDWTRQLGYDKAQTSEINRIQGLRQCLADESR